MPSAAEQAGWHKQIRMMLNNGRSTFTTPLKYARRHIGVNPATPNDFIKANKCGISVKLALESGFLTIMRSLLSASSKHHSLPLTDIEFRLILNTDRLKRGVMARSDIEEILIERGVKPTPQRVVIADYLLHTKSHPTADEVMEATAGKLPVALSRATVYNTLNALVEAGVVQEVFTEPGRTRYDANISDHHHFVDVKTGRIMDIPRESVPALEEKLGTIFRVHSYQVTFYGEMKE